MRPARNIAISYVKPVFVRLPPRRGIRQSFGFRGRMPRIERSELRPLVRCAYRSLANIVPPDQIVPLGGITIVPDLGKRSTSGLPCHRISRSAGPFIYRKGARGGRLLFPATPRSRTGLGHGYAPITASMPARWAGIVP